MTDTRAFLIDTDTASDDAVALIMALRHPSIDVKAITTVCGNVNVEQGTRNALYTAELCGSDVPIYMGSAKPLLRRPIDAHFFHGADGLGNMRYPAAKKKSTPGNAVHAIIEITRANPGIEWVTLGPLTNIALAVSAAPEIIPQVSRCVVMGGAANVVGNVTPAAEYNLWVDPEAAKMVFQSGLNVEMVGWELCRFDAIINPTEMQHIEAMANPLAQFTLDCNCVALDAIHEQTGETGLSLPDPVAMAIAIDSAISTRSSRHFVDIETRSELTRGMSVVDSLDVSDSKDNKQAWSERRDMAGSTLVHWSIDTKAWKELLFRSLQA